MWSLDQQALKTTKFVIITVASTFISLFFALFYLHHASRSDTLSLLTFDFTFHTIPTLEEPVSDNNNNNETHEELPAVDNYEYDVELVVASLKQQNASWYSTYFPDWKSNTYIVDEAAAPLTVPQNKGNEAMVYLTYIIDRYDSTGC
ncbi:hypothetical protein ZTR_08227 [Talaromyces verruculosus]|nr:hypothetical protein ZTR_08227 [Talaromyces verruculosus]